MQYRKCAVPHDPRWNPAQVVFSALGKQICLRVENIGALKFTFPGLFFFRQSPN